MRRLPLALFLLLSSCGLFGGSRPNYVVFFTEQSATLDEPAKSVVAQAAYDAMGSQAQIVHVRAYTAQGGAVLDDMALAGKRADVVNQALIADGVRADRILLEPRGPTEGDGRVEARRVEIVIGH